MPSTDRELVLQFTSMQSCQLSDGATMFSAALKALLLVLEHVSKSQNYEFIILFDSLCTVQGCDFQILFVMLLLQEEQELIEDPQKTNILSWIPINIGIPENRAGGKAAKPVLDLPIMEMGTHYGHYNESFKYTIVIIVFDGIENLERCLEQ